MVFSTEMQTNYHQKQKSKIKKINLKTTKLTSIFEDDTPKNGFKSLPTISRHLLPFFSCTTQQLHHRIGFKLFFSERFKHRMIFQTRLHPLSKLFDISYGVYNPTRLNHIRILI
ncbi:hypothetical protein HanIR_Chr15g0767621 [Helianthus annuus]|nr:hypothetical protein HanIR_Chr15g0767621 [Helianthus annuus]